jgi:hypothetical protein
MVATSTPDCWGSPGSFDYLRAGRRSISHVSDNNMKSACVVSHQVIKPLTCHSHDFVITVPISDCHFVSIRPKTGELTLHAHISATSGFRRVKIVQHPPNENVVQVYRRQAYLRVCWGMAQRSAASSKREQASIIAETVDVIYRNISTV